MKKLKFLDAEGMGKKVIDGDHSLNGFFGIGLSSKYYSQENLTLYAKWASQHFNSFLFVIADDPKGYNIMGFEGLSENKALEEARKKGDEKFEIVSKITEKFPHKIEVKRWNEITNNAEYNRILKQLIIDYDGIPILKEHIDNCLWANIEPKLIDLERDVKHKEFEKRFRVLVNYTIEEIALIVYLGEYHVYPIKLGHKGERVYDNVVDRIYSKHYNKIHQKILPIGQRGNIYLQVE